MKNIYDIETKKINKLGIEKISNNLWCIRGEDIYDGDQHTVLIETDKPIEIIEKLYKRTIKKGSHDIIFLPEINLIFDHGDYFVNYSNNNNRTSYFIRLYCRPLNSTPLYEEY